MKNLLVPQKIILKPVLRWSIEDRHDLRVFLRRLRVRFRLTRELERKPKWAAKFGELQLLTKNLLNTCGRVRDLDVARRNLRDTNWLTTSMRDSLAVKQSRANLKLSQQWTIARRRKLLNEILWFMIFSKNHALISKKKLTQAVQKLVDKLERAHPKTKKQWHKLRRLVRRTNYLNEILEHPDEFLVHFQKTLGDWHDLELYPSKTGHKKEIRMANEKLKRKNKKALKMLRTHQHLN